MLAAILADRSNVIERSKVVDLMKEMAFGNPSVQRGWIPDILMRVMLTPAEQQHIVIQNSPAGLLCTMRYPAFQPQLVSALEFVAIGSGRDSTIEIKKNADWVLAGMPGNDLIERTSLTSAVSQFIAENAIQDVGGMYPCIKIDRRGVGFLGIRHHFPLYEVSLTYDDQRSRWIQENHTTGKRIELLYPWEVLRNLSTVDRTFDDMREALEHANPLRARRVKSSYIRLPAVTSPPQAPSITSR